MRNEESVRGSRRRKNGMEREKESVNVRVERERERESACNLTVMKGTLVK